MWQAYAEFYIISCQRHRWALGPPTLRRADFSQEVGCLRFFRRAGGLEVGGLRVFWKSAGQKYMLNIQYSRLNRRAFGPPEGLLFAGGRKAGGRRAKNFPESSDFSGWLEVGGPRFLRRAKKVLIYGQRNALSTVRL